MYDLSFNVLTPSGLSAAQLNSVLTKGMSGLGQDFLDMESKYGINALFAISHAAIESAWGTSFLAVNRNNLFGIAAYDQNPNDAYSFPSISACIDYYGNFLKTDYLTPGGAWYTGGTSIHNVFIHYSTSGDVEGNNIATIMNQLQTKISDTTPPQVLSSQPHSDYTVQPGDNLSSIAAKFGIPDWHTLYNFDGNNAVIGANPDLIFGGEVLHIPSNAIQPSTPPVEAQRTYTVQSGDSLWAIAQSQLGNGARWGEIASLNHVAGPKYIIYPGQHLVLPN